MGNNQNCVKMKEPSNPALENSTFQSPYRTRSLANSVHYEEGNINIIINSKSSFLRPYSLVNDEHNEYIYEEANSRKFSDNPENFETEIRNLLSQMAQNLSDKRTQICLNLEGKYVTKQTTFDIMDFFENAKNMVKIEINLNNVYLNDEKFATIINSFQKHPEMLELTLKLSKNHLGYNSGKLISQLIAKLPDLKFLDIDLSYNPDMSGNGLEELADNLGLLEKLSCLKLELQATKINSSDLFFLELKESLLKMNNLTNLSLDLSRNFLKSNIIGLFISGLQNIQNLQIFSLNLSYNNLRAQDLYDLSSACSEFKNLEEFCFICNECGVSLSEYEILYMGLARLPKFRKLHLDFGKNYNANKIVNYLVDYINPETSFVSIKDVNLNLAFNLFQEINYENISFLFLSMKFLHSLEISLANNTMESKGLENIMCSLGGMKSLKHLRIDLKNSEVKNNGFEMIGNSLAQIKSLRSLHLGFQTSSCTFQNIVNFLAIINGLLVEKFALEVGEKIFHRDEINLLMEKLSSFKLLQDMDLSKNSNFFTLNLRNMEVFKTYLKHKKRVMYQAFSLNSRIADRTIREVIMKQLS